MDNYNNSNIQARLLYFLVIVFEILRLYGHILEVNNAKKLNLMCVWNGLFWKYDHFLSFAK